ncbi:flavodoxin family protein [Deferrisoma camini]|uniref:flavodoxin family protein n=1 Tax=Deferrisoma camini TaxID=1035120 RepID=UPI0004A2441D|nr:flavodoxin family protein [Deferrisoma camini]
MVQILVSYSSRSGNTEKLARAVARGAEQAGARVVCKRASDTTKEDLLAADGIILGSPVYFGTVTAEMKDLIDRSVGARRKLRNKVGAAFTTGGHHTGGKETTLLSMLMAFLIHEMVVVGDPIETGGHYGVACLGAPSADDERAGELLGARVADVARRLKAA